MNPSPFVRGCVVLLAVLLTGSGCTTLQRMSAQTPSVSLTSASVPEVSQEGFEVRLDGLVQNPNSVSLPLNDIDYRLFLNNDKESVIDAVATLDGSVAAGGEEAVTVTVPVRWESLLMVKDAVMETGGTIPYRMEGRMRVEGVPMVDSVPMSYEGELDVKSLARRGARFAWKNPALRQFVLGLVPDAVSGLPRF